MDCDVLIIGAGPAGMTAAVYAARADLSVVLLERSVIGGQSALTMDIANYPGFPDGISGEELSERMRRQAEKFGAKFASGEAERIEKQADGFLVQLKGGKELRAAAVVVATGSDPRPLGVPGETELRGRGVSYCGTCDAPFFREKRVVVVGGGDSALKEALHLAKFASKVTLVHRRDELRGEKIYQKQILEHEKITVRWDTIVTKINGEKKVDSVTLENVKTKETEDFEADGVFIFVGTVPNTGFLCNILKEDCEGHVRTDAHMKTEVDGLYAVGDVRDGSFRQIATGVGEGCAAAISIDHYLSDLRAKSS